jgi:hypothetical protein
MTGLLLHLNFMLLIMFHLHRSCALVITIARHRSYLRHKLAIHDVFNDTAKDHQTKLSKVTREEDES